MAKRLYRRNISKDLRDAPEADLVEEPADQRRGDEPEDLLRRTDREQHERDRRRADQKPT
jgi:hypothetical protein